MRQDICVDTWSSRDPIYERHDPVVYEKQLKAHRELSQKIIAAQGGAIGAVRVRRRKGA